MGRDFQYTKPPVDQYPYVREFPRPIEIFGNRDYQGYHVRGQILKFPYESFGPPLDESIIYHQLQLMVLVSASYKNVQTGPLQDFFYYTQLDDIEVEELWDRSGPGREGYSEPGEMAYEMLGEIGDALREWEKGSRNTQERQEMKELIKKIFPDKRL